MSKIALLVIALSCACTGVAQTKGRTARNLPAANPPACAPGAICFSGKVTAGQEFRKSINQALEFVLQPGWTIAIVPTPPQGDCQEFASVVNPPYRAHRALYIDTSYGFTAEDEIASSPREFNFVTNCKDYRTEFKLLSIVLWPYTVSAKEADEAMDKLGQSSQGKGRLWITGSQISHGGDTPDIKMGKVEWMTFSVEIVLPKP